MNRARPTQFWLVAHVRLNEALEIEELGGRKQRVGAYYQDFGVTAFTEDDAWSAVASAVVDGALDFAGSTCEQTAFEELHDSVRERSEDPSAIGIWYRSGRGFYPVDRPVADTRRRPKLTDWNN